MYVNTDDKGMINTSLCQRIFEKRDEPGVHRFVFSDESWIDATVSYQDLEALTNPSPLPAPIGFYHLKYHGDPDQGWLDRSPIIGWRGDFEFGATPITIEGDHTWGRDRAIQLPDGRVFDPMREEMFKTSSEWCKFMSENKIKVAA